MSDVRASEVVKRCGGTLYGPDITLSRRWSSDSREIEQGGAFAAIKGASVDGHAYIQQAADRGAKLILAAQSEVGSINIESLISRGVTVIAMADTVTGMAKIAKYYLQAVSPSVVGITGSVGKTTTRELLVAILKKRYSVHAAIRSFNTIIGSSLTVLNMPPATEVLVLELGTNHFGEISEMVEYFPPDTAIITDVAPAHLEGFGSLEGVLKAKLEICASAKLKNIVYNFDNQILSGGVESSCGVGINKISVGMRPGASVRIASAEITLKDTGPIIAADFIFGGREIEYVTPLFGKQHAYNIGFAIAAAGVYGITEDETASALKNSQPIAGRGVCRNTADGGWVIDEAYNANPTSMSAAISNVMEINKGRKYRTFAVLGGMRELGAASAELHAGILKQIEPFDKVALIGEEWATPGLVIPSNAKVCNTLDEIIKEIEKADMSGCILLVKGSNSYGLKKVVESRTGGALC